MPQIGRYAHITGWGAHVPSRAVTNDDLSQILPTSDAWIRQMTGIVERRIAEEGEYTSTMAIQAGRQALKMANLDPLTLDLVICATSTPDYLMPNTASLIQDGLGAGKAAAFDLNTACSGFVYAVSVAAGLIKGGLYERILVIGAESMSRVMNWSDRSTCVLFGDGAGAVVLEASDRPGGVLASKLGSDGSGGDQLMVGLGTRLPITEDSVARGETAMKMNGQQVFRFATRIMNEATREVTAMAGLQLGDIDLIIPHQANTRILEVAAKQLSIPPGRIYANLHRYGNTSAASIPLALVDALAEGRIRAGDHLVFVGFGGGLTWGACLVEWSYGPRRHWSVSQRAWRWMRDRVAGVKRGLHSLDRRLSGASRGKGRGADDGPWRGLGPGES